MAEQDVENLRGAYDSFNAGNPQTVLDLMAPDVEWIEPGGGNSASGTFSGPESVAADVFSTIPANFDEFSVNPEKFEDQGETVPKRGTTRCNSPWGTCACSLACSDGPYRSSDSRTVRCSSAIGAETATKCR